MLPDYLEKQRVLLFMKFKFTPTASPGLNKRNFIRNNNNYRFLKITFLFFIIRNYIKVDLKAVSSILIVSICHNNIHCCIIRFSLSSIKTSFESTNYFLETVSFFQLTRINPFLNDHTPLKITAGSDRRPCLQRISRHL